MTEAKLQTAQAKILEQPSWQPRALDILVSAFNTVQNIDMSGCMMSGPSPLLLEVFHRNLRIPSTVVVGSAEMLVRPRSNVDDSMVISGSWGEPCRRSASGPAEAQGTSPPWLVE